MASYVQPRNIILLFHTYSLNSAASDIASLIYATYIINIFISILAFRQYSVDAVPI